MKDITVILVNYSEQSLLNKALFSLNHIPLRVNSVNVIQKVEGKLNRPPEFEWSDRIHYTTNKDSGKALRDIIDTTQSHYVLFLHSPGHLSVKAVPHILQLQLDQSQDILGTLCECRDIVIRQPLLVKTSFLKNHPFLASRQLPFKEALLPAWPAIEESPHKTFQENLVKQVRKNVSQNTFERHKIIQKYQLEKIQTNNPSMSIIMSACNMETYAETAVMSCMLQSEQPDELLIMDDGSTDDSYERLRHYHDGLQVKVFRKENAGKARALNDLLPLVTSDYVLELDADDWLDPDAIFLIKKLLAELSDEVSVLYGNLRKWRQLRDDVLFKGVAKGTSVRGRKTLLSYRFPLGPRIYRTSSLKKEGGFPVIDFADGRLFEDVSVLYRLIKNGRFKYRDFTVYNVREHKESITKQHHVRWQDFLKSLE